MNDSESPITNHFIYFRVQSSIRLRHIGRMLQCINDRQIRFSRINHSSRTHGSYGSQNKSDNEQIDAVEKDDTNIFATYANDRMPGHRRIRENHLNIDQVEGYTPYSHSKT